MKRTIVLSVLAIVAFISGASAHMDAASSDPQKLLGTWKLVSYVGEEIPSGARADVMGPRPSGYINYGPDGRMIVIIVGSDRKKPVGPVATQEEAQDLITGPLVAGAARCGWPLWSSQYLDHDASLGILNII